MIKNYFKSALRNLLKNKIFNIINITGLSVGLASFIIILLYLNYELSYDKWDPSLKKVYKISIRTDEDINPLTPAPLASFLLQKYPDAEAATSIQPAGDFEVLLANGDKKIYQKGLVTVDSLFLKVFPYKLMIGNHATALNQPNAVILSEEVSHKLFENDNAIGKTVKIFNAFDGVITGVMEKPTGPSQLNAQLLMRDPNEKQNMFWQNYSYDTYLKLKHQVSEAKMENDINKIFYNDQLKRDNQSFEEYKKAGQKTALFSDAVQNLHNFPKYGRSNFKIISILLILAVLLLLAGAINFSNLSIAASINRAKEVGVRKVLGSGRKQLIWQFMSEIGLQCIISLCFAILIVSIALPYLNNSFNLSLNFSQMNRGASIILQIAICLITVTILSGLYPSIFLSGFNTTKVLKGDYSSGKKGMGFRNSLIVIQFIVATFFISGTLIISRQMHYMQNKNKGFSGTQVLRIQSTQKTRDANFQTTRNLLLSVPGVSYVSKTTKVPGDKGLIDTTTVNFKYNGNEYRMGSVKVSTDYFKTLKVDLIKGRFFDDNYADQNTRTAIINETAAKKLKINNSVGETISFPHCDSVPIRVVGIVNDFNTLDFTHSVQPIVYTIGNKACMFQSGGAILVKLNSDHLQRSIAGIVKTWKTIEPDFPIQYSFLDDNFHQMLISYLRLQKLITFFAIVAILISIMGLFALTALLTKQRTKEIGIRKILGANMKDISTLLSKDFMCLIIIAIVISIPIGWWAASKWLQTFAYRIEITWWLFAMAALIIILIALITISIQTIKVAIANPVESLRSE